MGEDVWQTLPLVFESLVVEGQVELKDEATWEIASFPHGTFMDVLTELLRPLKPISHMT